MAQFPIPVVRIILEDLEGRILLLRRSSKERYGHDEYCLPGGKVDYCKSVEDSCFDEVKEETGLDVSNLRFLFYQDNIPTSPGKMHVINLYFQADYSGEVQINNESSSFVWAIPHELSKYKIAFRNDEGIERYFETKR